MNKNKYLTIIPRGRTGYEMTTNEAHSAELHWLWSFHIQQARMKLAGENVKALLVKKVLNFSAMNCCKWSVVS